MAVYRIIYCEEMQGAAGSEAEKIVTSLKSLVETFKTGLEETRADYKNKGVDKGGARGASAPPLF